ncbi:hypothetical protein ES705_19857 [subsurface metagenome]
MATAGTSTLTPTSTGLLDIFISISSACPFSHSEPTLPGIATIYFPFIISPFTVSIPIALPLSNNILLTLLLVLMSILVLKYSCIFFSISAHFSVPKCLIFVGINFNFAREASFLRISIFSSSVP